MPDFLADLTSRNAQRVLDAAHAVIREPEANKLQPLVPHLSEIRAATQDLELGGALIPNQTHVQQAIRVIENIQAGACRCTLYPDYLFYDPQREETAGHVQITTHSEPDWNMTYQVECQHCGQEFTVRQGESHYTWWQWQATETASPVRKLTAKG